MHHTPLHTGKTSVREQIGEAHCDGIELADGEGERTKKGWLSRSLKRNNKTRQIRGQSVPQFSPGPHLKTRLCCAQTRTSETGVINY